MFARFSVLASIVFLGACTTVDPAARVATASPIPDDQQSFLDSCEDWDDWDKPAPPFRIYGGTYYVGTCGIAAILVTDRAADRNDGHTLIDTGTDKGAAIVLSNIAELGFDVRDIDRIQFSHEHFDHIGGIKTVQEATGAWVEAPRAAQTTLTTGLPSPTDPQAASGHPAFTPVDPKVVSYPVPGLIIMPPFNNMKAIVTPGHTPGARSWKWRDCEDGECRWIVYADSLSPISSDGYRFSDNPEYVQRYREGLERLRKADCDILLTPHPSASKMLDRMEAGSLLGGMTCIEYADAVGARLDARLAKEAAE